MDLFGTSQGLLVFILGFGFIVFVHELGHFLVAKWVGIKVEQFAIGMGHAIVSFRKGIGFRFGATAKEMEGRLRAYFDENEIEPVTVPAGDDDAEDDEQKESSGQKPHRRFTAAQIDEAQTALGISETEYRISWIPIGGYVKMLGQDDLDPAKRSTDPRSYNNKPIWARMCVISAGVIMNIIFGLIFFAWAFTSGVSLPPPIVGDVEASLPAATTYAEGHDNDPAYLGLKPGDRVVTINGEKVIDFSDIMVSAALSGESEQFNLEIQREGEAATLNYVLTPERVKDEAFAKFGIAMPISLQIPLDKEAEKSIDKELAKAGVALGMRVTHVNGSEVSTLTEYRQAVKELGGRSVELTLADNSNDKQLKVPLRVTTDMMMEESADSAHLLGIVFAPSVEVLKKSPAEEAGLDNGDLIVAINKKSWPTVGEIKDTVEAANGKSVSVTVRRNGKQITIDNVKPDKDNRIGIVMRYEHLFACKTLPDQPAAKIDQITPGSQITKVAGKAVESPADFRLAVQDYLAKNGIDSPVPVTFEANVIDTPEVTASLQLAASDLQALEGLAWAPAQLIPFERLTETVQADSIGGAIGLGIHKTHQTMMQVYMTLLRLIDRSVPVTEMKGPVGIAEVGTVIVRDHGFTYFLFFLGLISVNLAVINFLPIPVVDGGHMVFLIIEKIKGSPVSPKVQEMATLVGFGMILIVLVFTFFNDGYNLIRPFL